MSNQQGFSTGFGQSAIGDLRGNTPPPVSNTANLGVMVSFDDPRVKILTGIAVTWPDPTGINPKPFRTGRVVIVADYLTPMDNLTIDPLCQQPNRLFSAGATPQRGDGAIIFDQSSNGL